MLLSQYWPEKFLLFQFKITSGSQVPLWCEPLPYKECGFEASKERKAHLTKQLGYVFIWKITSSLIIFLVLSLLFLLRASPHPPPLTFHFLLFMLCLWSEFDLRKHSKLMDYSTNTCLLYPRGPHPQLSFQGGLESLMWSLQVFCEPSRLEWSPTAHSWPWTIPSLKAAPVCLFIKTEGLYVRRATPVPFTFLLNSNNNIIPVRL